MSITKTFVDDVFISYRHLDNQMLDESKGWIDNFHEHLERLLGETLGREPSIWRDSRLPANTYIAGALEERIKNTAVMISILSPGYLGSDWCRRELSEFFRLADQAGGLRVGNKMRAFKVVKTYVPRELHPPELQNQLGYEFFEIDMTTQRPVAFRQGVGLNRDQRYWNKLNDLAWDVKQVLSDLETRLAKPSSTSDSSETGKTIDPETTMDLIAPRDRIKDVPASLPVDQTTQLRNPEVFISHASEDLELASLVRTALEGAGIGCWMAHDDILPSEIYSSAIIRAMNLSRMVLLVFTSNANRSRHIETEIERAYNKEKPIILFRTEDIPLSESLEYYVSNRSWLIATEPPVHSHLPNLIVKVRQLCR